MKKIIAVLLGLFSVLILSEGILRGIGLVYNLNYGIGSEIAGKAVGGKTILFIGNSHTMGAGAPPGMGYPEQLQKLADQQYGKNKYRIVNLGRGNFNTRNILEHLESNVDKLKPDLVVMMVGEPNFWNLYGYGSYLQEKEKSWQWQNIYSYLDYSKTYRLINLLVRRAESRPVFTGADKAHVGWVWLGALQDSNQFNIYTMTKKEGEEAQAALSTLLSEEANKRTILTYLGLIAHRTLKDAELTLNYYEEVYKTSPDVFDYLIYRDLITHVHSDTDWSKHQDRLQRLKAIAGRNYPGNEKFKQLDVFYSTGQLPAQSEPESFLKTAIEVQPSYLKSYKMLADYYFNKRNYNKYIQYIQLAILANPINTQTNLFQSLHRMRNFYFDKTLLDSIDAFTENYKKRFPGEADRVEFLKSDRIAEWIKNDVIKMTEIIQKRGINFVIQNYPPARVGFINPINQIMKEIQVEKRYNYSDTEKQLNEVFKKDSKEKYYSNEYGPRDSHLNADGYKLVADLLFSDLRRMGFLK